MADDDVVDPLQGFHFTDYDEATGTLTVQLDPRVLSRVSRQGDIAVKAVEIITGGPGVESVVFVPRDQITPGK